MSVVNINMASADNYFYIGRKNDGSMHFGNPFSHLSYAACAVRTATREEAVANFRTWIRKEGFHDVEPERREWILANLHLLEGKDLGCFCKPKACHGDVYEELLAERRANAAAAR